MGSLPTISISVMTAPMVAQLTPEAVSGLKAEQVTAIPAPAVAGFNAMMIANLQVTAVVGFTHPQLALLPLEAMEGWKPETFAALNPEEVDGFNVYQLIQMLHKKPEIRKAITEEQWENLPITPDTPVLPVVEEITGEDSGEVIDDSGEVVDDSGEIIDDSGEVIDDSGEVIDDSGEVNLVEVTVDGETGEITLPPAEINLSEAEGITPADLEIGTVDLTTPLVIDGEELPPIVEQLEETLTDVGMPDLTVTQEDGIVNIIGSGDSAGTDLAFVPDEETIVRVEGGTPAGVTQDDNGFYVVVTADGIQMTFLPAPRNPVQLLKLANGNQGKGKLKKNKHGAFHFPVEGYGNVAAMFDPMVKPAPKGKKPGIFIEGMSGTVVYSDGMMQMIRPAMPEMAQLQVATTALLGKEVAFEYQANGTAEFELNGQNLKAIPTFEVAEDKPSDTSSQPVLEVVNAKEGEQVETLNEQGELVSEDVIAKATIATEEGTQELNVVKDAGNGETITDENITSAPDTTPSADSVTEPAENSEGNTTSVEEVAP
jgi:hypothetical protein